MVAAAAGLSVLLATSAIAFSIVKFTGAAYLLYLGIRMIVRAKEDLNVAQVSAPMVRQAGSAFLQGVFTEILNPKTALFFLAFIPQFVSRHGAHAFAGFLMLGLLSVTLNTAGDLVAVMMAAPLQKVFARSAWAQVNQRRASGLVMIALGAYVAVSDSR